jgi:hypothetical protein
MRISQSLPSRCYVRLVHGVETVPLDEFRGAKEALSHVWSQGIEFLLDTPIEDLNLPRHMRQAISKMRCWPRECPEGQGT